MARPKITAVQAELMLSLLNARDAQVPEGVDASVLKVDADNVIIAAQDAGHLVIVEGARVISERAELRATMSELDDPRNSRAVQRRLTRIATRKLAR